MRNSLDLSNRVAVVIGATSGLGRAIAIGLAEHGAEVIPTGRRLELVEEVCREIETAGRRTFCQTMDVTNRETIDALRDQVIQRFGRVDILVNGAGFTFKQPTVKVCEQQWSAIVDTNLNGAVRSCQSFYESLKASGRGRVINVVS